MATYKRSYHNNRRTGVFKIILFAIASLSLIITIGFGMRLYIIDRDLKQNKELIATMEKENIELESTLTKLSEETKGLQVQVENLKDILWKYEPVVIPDSMK